MKISARKRSPHAKWRLLGEKNAPNRLQTLMRLIRVPRDHQRTTYCLELATGDETFDIQFSEREVRYLMERLKEKLPMEAEFYPEGSRRAH